MKQFFFILSLLLISIHSKGQDTNELKLTQIILGDLFHKYGASNFFIPNKTKSVYLIHDTSVNETAFLELLKFENKDPYHLKLFYDTIDFVKFRKKIKYVQHKMSYSNNEFEFTFSRFFYLKDCNYQVVCIRKGKCKYPDFCYVFKFDSSEFKIIKWYCNRLIIDG
jgi:hypothetical protein